MITTGFITRCWTRRAEGLRRLALAFFLLVAGLGAARAETVEITQLRVERTDEGVLLSATVRFELPAAIDDALAKGVPMFFVAEAVLYQDRWYWYDRRVAGAARHMKLSYQPLTRRWRLQVSSAPIGNSGLTLGQSYDSREEALAAIQRFSQWRIAEPGELDPDARYNVDFKFRLDVSQLPRPIQIGTLGQSDWSLSAARNQRVPADPR